MDTEKEEQILTLLSLIQDTLENLALTTAATHEMMEKIMKQLEHKKRSSK